MFYMYKEIFNNGEKSVGMNPIKSQQLSNFSAIYANNFFISKRGVIRIAPNFISRKRGLDYEEIAMDAVNITFNIFADKSGSNAVNCKTKICPMLRIPDAYCERFCFPAYSRFLRLANIIFFITLEK